MFSTLRRSFIGTDDVKVVAILAAFAIFGARPAPDAAAMAEITLTGRLILARLECEKFEAVWQLTCLRYSLQLPRTAGLGARVFGRAH